MPCGGRRAARCCSARPRAPPPTLDAGGGGPRHGPAKGATPAGGGAHGAVGRRGVKGLEHVWGSGALGHKAEGSRKGGQA